MIAMSAMVAAALVLRDDEVLLIRQTGLVDPTPYWSIPGGIVERGEFVHDALVREVREETGLSVAGPARLAWVSQHESPEGQLTAFGFEVTVAPGDPAPADPDGLVLEAAWVPVPDALDRLATIRFGPMRDPVRHHLRTRTAPTLWSWSAGVDAAPVVLPIG